MEKFTLEILKELPEYGGEGVFTGSFYNEVELLTGAYRDANSSIHLVVECDEDVMNNITLHGVEIRKIQINHPDVGEKNFLDYCPSHIDFLENVLIICNEIISAVDNGEESSVATQRILEKWHYFLSKPRSNKLSDEEITGMYGELLVLEWLLDQGKSETDLIKGWSGPSKNPRDFEFNNYWIEVKSTKRRDNQVDIHGIEQLESPADKPLYVWLNVLIPAQNMRSLVELITEIENKLTSVINVSRYRDKVHEYGYDAAFAGLYINERFELARSSVFHVDNDFPRITRQMISLPARVVTLGYTIDLNGIREVLKENVFSNEL
jgi:hypothetical protein